MHGRYPGGKSLAHIFLTILRGAMSSRGRRQPSDGCRAPEILGSRGKTDDDDDAAASVSYTLTWATISSTDDDSADDEINNDGGYLININAFFLKIFQKSRFKRFF